MNLSYCLCFSIKDGRKYILQIFLVSCKKVLYTQWVIHIIARMRSGPNMGAASPASAGALKALGLT